MTLLRRLRQFIEHLANAALVEEEGELGGRNHGGVQPPAVELAPELGLQIRFGVRGRQRTVQADQQHAQGTRILLLQDRRWTEIVDGQHSAQGSFCRTVPLPQLLRFRRIPGVSGSIGKLDAPGPGRP